jgi:hypothetical protein
MNRRFKLLARKYNTPAKVQTFLRTMPYNNESDGETLRSASEALKKRKAHCLEAAFLAAAILEHVGYSPLVMSLESKDNLDHVIFVFRHKGKWGSVARSRDEGLHGRKPVFSSMRNLALSYYESYIDKTGCITGFQIANLDDSKADWRHSKNNVWKAEKFLIDLKHKKIKFNSKRYARIHRRYLKGRLAKKKPSWL